MTAAIHFINIYFVSFPFSSFPVPSGIRLNLTFNILLLSTSSTWKRYSLKSIISLRRGKSPFISNKRPAKVSTSSVNLPKSEGSALRQFPLGYLPSSRYRRYRQTHRPRSPYEFYWYGTLPANHRSSWFPARNRPV